MQDGSRVGSKGSLVKSTLNGSELKLFWSALGRNRGGMTYRCTVPIKGWHARFNWGQMQRFIKSVYPLSKDGITWRLWGPLDATDLDLTYDYEGGKQTLEDSLNISQPLRVVMWHRETIVPASWASSTMIRRSGRAGHELRAWPSRGRCAGDANGNRPRDRS